MPRYKFQRENIMDLQEVRGMIERTHEVVPGYHVVAFRALLALLYLTGARISEVLALKTEDVWTDDKYLYVRIKTRKQRPPGPFNRPWRILMVRISHPLIPYITRHLSEAEPGFSLFQFATGHPETERNVVWKYIKALNPQASSHVFRHSRLTLLAMRGATGPELQEWAGHSDLRSASKYLHLSGQGIKRLADRVD
ncbi:MAG: site-specific integrase [Candidatus Hadarchaeales archaeon]